MQLVVEGVKHKGGRRVECQDICLSSRDLDDRDDFQLSSLGARHEYVQSTSVISALLRTSVGDRAIHTQSYVVIGGTAESEMMFLDEQSIPFDTCFTVLVSYLYLCPPRVLREMDMIHRGCDGPCCSDGNLLINNTRVSHTSTKLRLKKEEVVSSGMLTLGTDRPSK